METRLTNHMIRPWVSAYVPANSATNPQYQFNVLVTQIQGPTGKVGDIAEAKVSWPITGAVTRAIV